MEKFLDEVREFAKRREILPATVIHNAVNRNSMTWEKWVNGTSSPTFRTIDRVREYMLANAEKVGATAK